ncbi:MAG: DUF839 domain-containing protein [Chloroflexi bacterium AL-W]|nr:DUF839 domain-containing protein [Chloroflexi bacterium AL-N1]NOK68840.1 DUF839 domain-containing protein [Chloroflexi bacterium AL-N10]NOK76824.1 DUF839 domain-containing protein [Chloroflexi bacterium AL-N5]NOK82789.1 DUF839 domain-containing protein [Chloroflexi bacterium AL-W]NOK90681.1 DUF839 domain-containing protein [Chloroflexi bacterium AL-N15]
MSFRNVALIILVGTLAGVIAIMPSTSMANDTDRTRGGFQFTPLPDSAVCTPEGNVSQPFVLPTGFTQTLIASEPDFPDVPDQNTVNETGPDSGRFLYRVHRTDNNGAVSVTDLRTGETNILAQREDWDELDGIVWTPWRTILVAEETLEGETPDPDFPDAESGLIYELDPHTGEATVLPALGARPHEGIRFDRFGNIYGVSAEQNPGYIYKFTPDRRGNLSEGQLFALKIVHDAGEQTGLARWIPLDRDTVKINSDAAARAAGATGYGSPEDVETAVSTGRDGSGGRILYVSLSDEDRVLAINLRNGRDVAIVSNYVKEGVNAPEDFDNPDNLALDRAGNLYINEDIGGSFEEGKRAGDDIWVAPPARGTGNPAGNLQRFASLTACNAEGSGAYFSRTGDALYVNIQRGEDEPDLAIAIGEGNPYP